VGQLNFNAKTDPKQKPLLARKSFLSSLFEQHQRPTGEGARGLRHATSLNRGPTPLARLSEFDKPKPRVDLLFIIQLAIRLKFVER
jgi:hypothetical protein